MQLICQSTLPFYVPDKAQNDYVHGCCRAESDMFMKIISLDNSSEARGPITVTFIFRLLVNVHADLHLN